MNKKLMMNVVIFVAFANIVSLAFRNKIDAIVLFFAVAFLVNMYTKNKMYVILVALIASNALDTKLFEGMEHGKKSKESDEDDESGDEDDESDDDNSKNNKDEKDEDDKQENNDKDDDEDDNRNKEEFQNENDTFEAADNLTLGKRVDYTTTLEQAYSNLQGILGKEGISGLTKHTEKLLDQQKNLMDSLVQMGPIVDNAQKTLKGLKLDGMPDIFNNK